MADANATEESLISFFSFSSSSSSLLVYYYSIYIMMSGINKIIIFTVFLFINKNKIKNVLTNFFLLSII